MDLEFSPEDLAFQQEARQFIAENYPDHLRGKQDEGEELDKEDYLSWHRILAKKGWIAPAWPVEYGGTGWTATQRFIWSEELARADCLMTLPFGLNMVGPVIYTFGTQEQKARFLPRILSGEDWWCQGYSEPGSGSDLASLRTKAVRDGGHYVVNGQKTWTTMAQHADWGFFLVRTDSDAKRPMRARFLQLRHAATLDARDRSVALSPAPGSGTTNPCGWGGRNGTRRRPRAIRGFSPGAR